MVGLKKYLKNKPPALKAIIISLLFGGAVFLIISLFITGTVIFFSEDPQAAFLLIWIPLGAFPIGLGIAIVGWSLMALYYKTKKQQVKNWQTIPATLLLIVGIISLIFFLQNF